MGKQDDFEMVFRDFVKGFGGEVLPETSDNKTADYLFPKHNIIAELKCLMQDQTEAMTKKVAQAVRDWWKNGGKIPEGYDANQPLEISTAPKEIADQWLEILKAPIENCIRDANRQIRETKHGLDMPDAKGLVLFFNQGNSLHSRPKDFRLLAGSVLRKRDKDKELRFPHINGLIYFSYETIKTEKEKMNFWAPMQIKHGEEDVTPMSDFQKELEQGFYAYVEKKYGKTVRQFEGG